MGIKTLYIPDAKIRIKLDLKVKIRKIKIVAPLSYDFFVLLSNLPFESQSNVILTGGQ